MTVCTVVIARAADRERGAEDADDGAAQHVAPVVLVVADAWQTDVEGGVDAERLQHVLQQATAPPAHPRLEVELQQ